MYLKQILIIGGVCGMALSVGNAASLNTSSGPITSPSPSYQAGVLTIPSVDTPEQVGKYSDASFTLNNNGTWNLNAYQETDASDKTLPGIYIKTAPVSQVKLITSTSMPIQVFLKVNGSFKKPCDELGQANYRLADRKFIIQLNMLDGFHVTSTCRIDTDKPFETVLSLPVFGLAAGTYDYQVNGQFQGSFTLTTDNQLPNSTANN